jgi:creatinine amidohydrolase
MATTTFIPPEFESTSVGRLKQEIWEAGESEIDRILREEFAIPSPGEMETPGSYIQMTHSDVLADRRLRNDIVLIPLGSTEFHGRHSVSAQDTLQVTRLVEGVRRATARQGRDVALAWSPWLYGNHPKHHVGLIGTIPISQSVLEMLLVDVMFGLWSQGYRKMVFVNNHAQHWVISSAIDRFALRYPELPFFAMAVDWCCAMAEFFRTADRGGPFQEDFIHADESETSLALLLAPETVDMENAVDTEPHGFLPDGHFNKSAAQRSRPNLWWAVRNNTPLEIIATPEGVVGKATLATAEKAKPAVAGALRYLMLLIDELLEAFPPGTAPPIEEVTMFDKVEIEGYLRRPGEDGYHNPYRLWRPFQ